MEKVRIRHGEPSGTYCVAWGCSNRQKTGDGRKFHRFPNDALRRKKWVAALKRDGFDATVHSRICSDHFEKESYNMSGRLKYTAVPTIFNFPDHMCSTESKTRKTPIPRVCMSETMAAGTTSSSANKPASPQPEPETSHMCSTASRPQKTPVARDCMSETMATGTTSFSADKPAAPQPEPETSHMRLTASKPQKTPIPKVYTSETMATGTTSSSANRPASPQPEPATCHMIEDHGYCVSSPRKTKRKVDELEAYALSYKKKLKIEKQRSRRLAARVVSFSDIVKYLRKNNFISDSCAEMLENSFWDVPLELMKRLLQHKEQGGSFHPSLKAFAITLQFYSSKAYKFVRDTFGLGLPAITTLREWFHCVDGKVGFNKSAMQSLGQKVAEARKQDREVLCALMLGEMAVKKNIEFDGKKTVGFVDIGNGVTDDSAPPATQALVFMLVCVNGSWRVPIAFFFTHSMTGQEKANLIRECLHQLNGVGVKVISLTCDGPSSHMTMLKELGASMKPEDLDPSFPHPSSRHRIFVILDVCHMLKLLQNCLATCGLLKDEDGLPIRWSYMEDLNNIQERESLHLANKLRKVHIRWKTQKLKVKLAEQSFSTSVADALEYCRDGLQLPNFQNVQGTIQFLRIINNLFDILNSRNQYARGMKGALKPDTPDGGCTKMVFLEEAFQYIKTLTNMTGEKMYTTNKKTAFIGFLTAIKAVEGIYSAYVGKGKPLKYLLTYKLSHDNLELFFNAIRAHGGSNNNPTVRQFVACFNRMILRHDIKRATGNITPQDKMTFLMATVTKEEQDAVEDDTKDILMARRYQLISELGPEDESSIINEAPPLPELSIYRESAVGYIAGYVTRMVITTTKCPDCQGALYVTAFDGSQPNHGLILLKDQGGLIKPSPSVVDICLQSERIFQRLLYVNEIGISQCESLPEAIAYVVLQNVGNQVFGRLGDHMLDTQPENNHIFALIKAVACAYTKIRMHHLVKKHNTQITWKYIRKVMPSFDLF